MEADERFRVYCRELSAQVRTIAFEQPVWTAEEVDGILRTVIGSWLLTMLDHEVANARAQEN